MHTLLIAYASLVAAFSLGYCVGAIMAKRGRAPEPYRRIDPGRS